MNKVKILILLSCLVGYFMFLFYNFNKVSEEEKLRRHIYQNVGAKKDIRNIAWALGMYTSRTGQPVMTFFYGNGGGMIFLSNVCPTGKGVHPCFLSLNKPG